jgi:ASCH domain-containing protein
MRALSVRQPWAELILLGDKTIECRSRPTRVQGRVWIYASQARSGAAHRGKARIADAEALPRGVIVGSVELVGCRPLRSTDSAAACAAIDFDGYAWLLANPQRLSTPRRPTLHPQPVFFYPFGRTA